MGSLSSHATGAAVLFLQVPWLCRSGLCPSLLQTPLPGCSCVPLHGAMVPLEAKFGAENLARPGAAPAVTAPQHPAGSELSHLPHAFLEGCW